MIDTLFSTLIYRDNLSIDNSVIEQKALRLKSTLSVNNDWQCDTFTTLGTEYNMLLDPEFLDLIKICETKVYDFAESYGDMSKYTIRCVDSWINVAGSGEYQEYHKHSNRHFSLVYYVKTPPNCGNIVFKAYDTSGDMFPLPFNSIQEKEPSYRTYYYNVEESQLLIFKSNLEHMVQKNRSNQNRISIAMNFLVE